LYPELTIKIIQAARDRITPAEFQDIMNAMTVIAVGTLIGAVIGMLIGSITEKFARETPFEIKEIAGVPLPVIE